MEACNPQAQAGPFVRLADQDCRCGPDHTNNRSSSSSSIRRAVEVAPPAATATSAFKLATAAPPRSPPLCKQPRPQLHRRYRENRRRARVVRPRRPGKECRRVRPRRTGGAGSPRTPWSAPPARPQRWRRRGRGGSSGGRPGFGRRAGAHTGTRRGRRRRRRAAGAPPARAQTPASAMRPAPARASRRRRRVCQCLCFPRHRRPRYRRHSEGMMAGSGTAEHRRPSIFLPKHLVLGWWRAAASRIGVAAGSFTTFGTPPRLRQAIPRSDTDMVESSTCLEPPMIAVKPDVGHDKKGPSFISSRQRREEGTFCASGLAGIEPTPARSMTRCFVVHACMHAGTSRCVTSTDFVHHDGVWAKRLMSHDGCQTACELEG